ncbi:MAG: hypothetical protein M1831_005106 [Alyxoria varia]|nr:MAG: hypothetical protein M1831_005106 [Alyxoria varia]
MDATNDQNITKRTRLKFKSRHPSNSPPNTTVDDNGRPREKRHKNKHDSVDDEPHPEGESRRRHHHKHHRYHRRHYDRDGHSERGSRDNLQAAFFDDPDAAFRESLFDAMADDEGADYWASIYGQPMHIYSNVKQSEEGGELEQMSDEEYVSYVRARMWEKTHQHVLEERAKREDAKKRQAEERRERAREAEDFRQQIEQSLKRGQERKSRKNWKEAWAAYDKGWQAIMAFDSSTDDTPPNIPWPVKSGEMEHVSQEEVELFFGNGVGSGERSNELLSLLKVERVRWHPDKMNQRVGARHLEEAKAKEAVTAVFQIIDSMWSNVKNG